MGPGLAVSELSFRVVVFRLLPIPNFFIAGKTKIVQDEIIAGQPTTQAASIHHRVGTAGAEEIMLSLVEVARR